MNERAHAQALDARSEGQSDATALAKKHFESGVAAYAEGRHADALESFQEAYRLKPHPLVRVNIANCYDKLDRPIEALFHFELFLESNQGTPEQRAEVKDAIAELQNRVGRLALQITPQGANVFVDDEPARRAPVVDLLSLRAGTHRVRVELDGYQAVERALTVEPNKTAEVIIDLESANANAPAALAGTPADEAEESASMPEDDSSDEVDETSAEQAEARGGGLSTRVWIAGGVTLALAVAGTITGVLALSAEGRFEEHLRDRYDPALTVPQWRAAWSRARTAADDARALALTTDILLGGALVGAVVTTLFVLSDVGDDDGGASSSAKLSPRVSTHGASLRLSGAF